MNDLKLPRDIISGYFDCSLFGDLKRSPERVRTLYEIELYLEDGRYTYTDGVAYPIKKGHLRIGSPGEKTYSLLPFRTKYIRFSANGRLAEIFGSLPRYFRSRHPYELEVMLDEIISLQQSRKNDLMLVGKVMTLLATVVNESKSSMIEGVSEAVLEAKSFINTHLSEPIALTDIASAVNLSPNYLHTVFKRSVGMTPRDYLTEKRLSLAAELLCTTSLSISEIAERCGFCNQQYLSGMFSKRFLLTPSAYRRKNVNDYLI